MKIISKQKRSEVYYDEKNEIFIKVFKPKLSFKFKYFLHLRKYPGKNFVYIKNEIDKLGFSTVEIIDYSNYSVTTKEIIGVPLNKFLKENPNSKILDEFIHIIVTLLRNNIYCGDFSYDNFMVSNNKIILLDLEDYRKVTFLKRGKNEAIKRMKGKMDNWVIEKIKACLFT